MIILVDVLVFKTIIHILWYSFKPKTKIMNITEKEINHVETLLTKKGCSSINCTPYALQIIRRAKKSNKSVFDLQLTK